MYFQKSGLDCRFFYLAPEIFASHLHYGPQVDMFSCGAVFYELLTKHRLQSSFCFKDLMQGGISFSIQANQSAIKHITGSGRNLLVGLLRRDPKNRLYAFEALSLDYFQTYSRKNHTEGSQASRDQDVQVEKFLRERKINQINSPPLQVLKLNFGNDADQRCRKCFIKYNKTTLKLECIRSCIHSSTCKNPQCSQSSPLQQIDVTLEQISDIEPQKPRVFFPKTPLMKQRKADKTRMS